MRVARHIGALRREAYWHERPYVDTGFGYFEHDMQPAHCPAPGPRTEHASLADVAANPGHGRSRRTSDVPGPQHAHGGAQGKARNLADMAAQGQ